MQTFADPNVPMEPLPFVSDLEDRSSPEVVSQFSSIWDDLDNLGPEFSTNEEEDRIQALTGYMLNIFEHGPDTINSDDEFDLEHSDFGDNPDPENDINARGDFQPQVPLNFYSLLFRFRRLQSLRQASQ